MLIFAVVINSGDCLSKNTLTNNGGTLGPTGITFGQGQGPSVNGVSPRSTYTITTAFTLNSLNGTGTAYVKLIDFGLGDRSPIRPTRGRGQHFLRACAFSCFHLG